MAALATLLCDAQGAYRGPAGDVYVFMTFGTPRIEKKMQGQPGGKPAPPQRPINPPLGVQGPPLAVERAAEHLLLHKPAHPIIVREALRTSIWLVALAGTGASR
jgi:hypothetical protein